VRKYLILLTPVIVFALTCAVASNETRSISGKVIYNGRQSGDVILQLHNLRVSSKGNPVRLQKRDIYGSIFPFKVIKLENPGSYSFTGLPPGYYSVLAFMDTNKDNKLGFNPPEPFGWFSGSPGASYDPINIIDSSVNNAELKLRVPTPFPKDEKHAEHGALRWIKGVPVLQLWGTAEERGFAHGYLLTQQIIDFFQFYIVEDNWRSPQRYQKIYVPFLESHFNYPPEFLSECNAVIKGMEASGVDMQLDFLDRNFNRTDLMAINNYIEKRAAFPVSSPSSCTQFAFWGTQTEGSELKGGLIAARNMDGECDVRKVTVSHFILFAVRPSEPGRKRWVSAMWPGFVGTISGVNEEGLYCMENAGGTGPGPIVGNIVPCSWIMRYILENQGRKATLESIDREMKKFKCEGGGATASGSIILWAVPYHSQDIPAFVYEGDRFGWALRGPTEVRPNEPTNILAANHHMVYGCDPEKPGYYFNRQASFSSRWRYEAAMDMLEAWSRKGKALGIEEAKRLLQTVSHGSTEYSVIFLPNTGHIFVAVDDLKTDMWDAPYMPWIDFSFDELFKK